MDIDAEIRDILMKSTPVNDNSAKTMPIIPQPPAHNWGVNIVGNQNIVVSTGTFQLFALFCLFAYYISLY